jgi:hypothetical protein
VNFPFSSVQLTHAFPEEVWIARNVAPGTAAPSEVRATPVSGSSADAFVSVGFCAASWMSNNKGNDNNAASSTANLLATTYHAPSSPLKIPNSSSLSSKIRGRGGTAVLPMFVS